MTHEISMGSGWRRDYPQGFAWALALFPIWIVFVGLALRHFGVSSQMMQAGSLGLMIGCATADRVMLQQAGIDQVPRAAWGILPPVYLWRRATRLGEARLKSWISLGLHVAFFSVIFAGEYVEATGFDIPSCDSAQASAMQNFDGSAIAKGANVQAISMAEIQETSFTNNVRSCTAVINGSGGSHYNLEYTLFRKDRRLYIQEKLR